MNNTNKSYRGNGGIGDEYLPEGSGVGRFFGYVRRSAIDRTNKPLSVQIETINEYCERNLDNQKITKFFGDNGVSGNTPIEKRDGLRFLFEEIKRLNEVEESEDNKSFNFFNAKNKTHIIVYDVSRLARSVSVGMDIKKEIERVNAVLHIATTGMVIENITADLYYGLDLTMAENDRSQTISRIRTYYSTHKKDWNPKKGFGWKFNGPGVPPTEIPEEQIILKEIGEMYLKEKMDIRDIAKKIKEKYPSGRRCRKDEDNETEREMVSWTSYDIHKIIERNFGDYLSEELENEIVRLLREGKKASEIYSELKGQKFGGKIVTLPTIRKLVGGDLLPDWKRKAFFTIVKYLNNEKYSIDDIIEILNEQHPHPIKKDWNRQTACRFISDVRTVLNIQRKV